MIHPPYEHHGRGRDAALDALRGAAILLVVFGHGIQYSGGPDYQQTFISRAVISLQMPLFFVISGYLFKEPLSRKGALQKIRDRGLSLLVPFFFWTLFWYTCQTVTGGVLTKNMTWHTIWFLPVLFACFSLHVAVVLISRGGPTVGRAFLGLSAIILMYCLPRGIWLSSIRYYYAFFLAGALAREDHLLGYHPSRRITAASVAVWLALLPFWRFGAAPEWLRTLIANPHLQGAAYVLFRWTVALSGVFAACSLILLLPQSVGRGLSYIGLYTMQIYVVHIGLLDLTYSRCVLYGGWFWVCTVLLVLVPILIAWGAAQNPYVDMVLFGRRISRPRNAPCPGILSSPAPGALPLSPASLAEKV